MNGLDLQASNLETVKNILGTILVWADSLRLLKTSDVDVFIQSYHPTRGIVERLKHDGRLCYPCKFHQN